MLQSFSFAKKIARNTIFFVNRKFYIGIYRQEYCCSTSNKIRSVRALNIREMMGCVLVMTSLPYLLVELLPTISVSLALTQAKAAN